MAEKKVIEIEIQDNTKSLKAQYREAVQEVQKLVQAYGETSQEAAEAAKRAAELKDQIEDTNDAIAAFKGEGVFNATGKAISSVASGFSAVEGAMGLVGVESEKLQETMLRVQSAMALAQGLQGLEDAGRAFKQLGAVAINAFKGIRGAILATGIGVLVVALGTVVAYWDDIKAAVSGVSDEQSKLNAKTEANLKASEEKVSALDKQDNILKLQGKSEKEILQYKVLELDAAIKIAQTNLENQKATKKAQVEAAKRNKDILVGILDFLSIPLNLLLKTVDKVASAVGVDSNLGKWFDSIKNSAANLIFDPKETANEGDEAIKAAEEKLTELKNQQAGYQLQIKEINKQAVDAAKKAKQDEADAKLAAEKEYNEKLRAYYDAIEQERQSQITDAKEKELQALDNKYEELYARADAANQSDKELIKKHQEEVIAINQKYALIEAEIMAKAKLEANRLKVEAEQEFQAQIEALQEANFQAGLQKKMTETEYEKELVRQKYFALEEAAKGNAEQEKIIAEAKARELEEIDKKSKEKQIAAENELRQKRLQLAGQAFTAIGDIIGAFTTKNEKDARKQFKISKAFNLAAALTNTYLAVTGALTAGGNPIKLATGQQIAEAAIVGTMGLANVVKIANTQFGSGSGASGGGGGSMSASSGGGIVAPNLNVVGDTGINQLAQLGQTPIKAYVVSNDITTAQMFDLKVQQTSSL
jgi:hypothetical protein